MKSRYEEIYMMPGYTIKEAVRELLEFRKKGKLVFCTFNGHKLYSDTVSYDSAYKEITGLTMAEYQEKLNNTRKKTEKAELEFEKLLPIRIDKWIERGKRILTEDKHEEWIRIVPIRANDLYKGMELDACLEIIKVLNNEGSLEVAKELLENQNHSGMSFNLVCSMIRGFCARGEEFVNYVS